MTAPNPSRSNQHDIAVVTGAGSGLGKALGIELSRRGVFVVGLGRRDRFLEETARLAVEGMFIPKTVDIGDADVVGEAFAEIRRDFGNVTILVNNAAVHPRRDFLQETYGSFMDSVAINLGGVISCTKAALATMTQSGVGRILNVGSFADLHPQPGSAAYCVSKGAARTFARALVADISDRFPDIVISTWMPGILATEMGLPNGLDPAVAARWGAELALCRDRSLNGTIFERDREVLEHRSLKRRIFDRVMFKSIPVARRLGQVS